MSCFKEDCRRLEVFSVNQTRKWRYTQAENDFFAAEVERIQQSQRKYLGRRSTKRLMELFRHSWPKSPVRSQLIFEVLNRRVFQSNCLRHAQAGGVQ
jgi:hypothetical protein